MPITESYHFALIDNTGFAFFVNCVFLSSNTVITRALAQLADLQQAFLANDVLNYRFLRRGAAESRKSIIAGISLHYSVT